MADWSRRKFLTVTSVAAVAATRLTAAEKRKAKKKGPAGPLRYAVHPAVGVARLGDSTDEFYLEPETIGGLPIECTHDGAPIVKDGKPVLTRKFKDAKGRIRRQAAQFRVFVFGSNDPADPGREITLDDPSVESIEWTVHLANKKGVWYNNQEFIGNVYLAGQPGAETTNANYYWSPNDDDTPSGVPSLRNSDVSGHAERQKQLIIDPGPRTVKAPGEKGRFSRDSKPPDYPF